MKPSAQTGVVVALVVAAVAGTVIGSRAVRQQRSVLSIGSLEPQDRTALFECNMKSFEAICVEKGWASFEQYCSGAEELIGLFPDCDEACRALLANARSGPTR